MDEGHVKSKRTSGRIEPGTSRVARRSKSRKVAPAEPSMHACAAAQRKESRLGATKAASGNFNEGLSHSIALRRMHSEGKEGGKKGKFASAVERR